MFVKTPVNFEYESISLDQNLARYIERFDKKTHEKLLSGLIRHQNSANRFILIFDVASNRAFSKRTMLGDYLLIGLTY